MNILHLISSGGFYGAERVVVELAAYTRAQGHSVAVWVLESPGADAMMAALGGRDVPAERIRVGRTGLAGVCRRLRRRVRESGVEILHSHGYRTDVAAALGGAFSPVRRVATCHTWYSTTARLRFYEKVDKGVLRFFDRVVVVSPPLRREVEAAGIPGARVRLVENGTDFAAGGEARERAEALREEYGLGRAGRLLLRVGRLDWEKGNRTLLEAFAAGFGGREAVLVFVGEGTEREDLEEMALRLGIREQVVFAGYRREVSHFLLAADLFVISSWKEGLPIALLEAMALRKAVVATDVGAIGSVIVDGENGCLVPPRDAEALCRALRLVADDAELAARLAQGAWECYRRNHTLEAMGRRYLEVYRECLEER